jgi:hypothetical protein
MNTKIRSISVIAVCLYFWYYLFTYTDWHFIDGANLVFHEAGHSIFFFLGDFLRILAGSGLQIILPAVISIYFFYNRQKISGALCILWVGQNLLNVSIYVGDAIKMELALVGGENVVHDWNYLLSSLGILKYTSTLSSVIYFLGFFTILAGTILSLSLLKKEMVEKRS